MTIPKPTPKVALITGKQIVAPLQPLIGGRILALREQRVMLDATPPKRHPGGIGGIHA